jgi:hypothetical protein
VCVALPGMEASLPDTTYVPRWRREVVPPVVAGFAGRSSASMGWSVSWRSRRGTWLAGSAVLDRPVAEELVEETYDVVLHLPEVDVEELRGLFGRSAGRWTRHPAGRKVRCLVGPSSPSVHEHGWG